MIITEMLSDKLVRTYSDAGLMIERGGVRYSEAVDPVGSGRTYTETDETIPDAGLDAENPDTLKSAVNIMFGNADDEIEW